MVRDLDLTGGDRLPPQSLEAEEEILGGILLDPEAMTRVAEILVPEAFYLSAHQEIYRAALTLHTAGRPTDLTSVTAWLDDQGKLDKIGGVRLLRQLVEQTVSSINIDQYAQLVQEKYLRRRLIQTTQEIARLAYDHSLSIAQVMDQAEQRIFEISQVRAQRSLVPISDILLNTFTDLEQRYSDAGSHLPGIPTAFYDLDAMTQGLQRSDLIIVAGRPSMGKTAFSLSMAHNVAARVGSPVAIFSLEMSREQLVQRLLASEARVEGSRLRSGRIPENLWPRLSQAIGTLAQLPIFIDDTANATLAEIRSKARRLQAEQGQRLGMVLLDYLQLMEGGSENRVQELSRITRGLKALAKELEAPVVVLSQLSRAVESRSDKRPQLSDLRESGCLSGKTTVADVDSGKPWTLEQLASLQGRPLPRILSLNQRGRLVPQQPLKAFASGIQKVYRLKTLLNYEIVATGNHPFYTQRGWQPLDDLQLEESIAVKMDDDELLWDPVVTIEEAGEEAVFDLEMPRHHNFVANGILVHNSIEQDADVVMMLYRPEYYDPNTTERGIAEVIIAKHRNGPTGTVKLLFESQYIRFVNLAEPHRS
ncbi:MAG: replicative DNA helicase [Thermostichales cyanobacterium DRC_bins_46]